MGAHRRTSSLVCCHRLNEREKRLQSLFVAAFKFADPLYVPPEACPQVVKLFDKLISLWFDAFRGLEAVRPFSSQTPNSRLAGYLAQ